jgi:hypothetical protein
VTKPASNTSDEPGISVSAALTSPPVQLSATAMRRPAARLASSTLARGFDQLGRENRVHDEARLPPSC